MTQAQGLSPARRLAAWLLVAVAVLSVVGGVIVAYPDWMTGVIGWVACLLSLSRMRSAQRKVALALVIVGVAGIAWGTLSGHAGLVNRALTQNTAMVGMLIAVSFLQLISMEQGRAQEPLSQGRGALLRTLIGVHLFGAVINYSAVAIFADRLSARARLSVDQATALAQSFNIGALWSPFYGAMAVALTFAPNASLTRLMAIGVPVAIGGIVITWLTLSSSRHNHARDFEGYPLHLEALWVPFVLALCVLGLHEARPDWSVLAVIALMAPVVTALTLLFREGTRAGSTMLRLVHVRLPEMGGEMLLFMAAGVLSAGVSGALAALDFDVPFRQYGAFEASLTVSAIVFAAWLGLHPVILTAVAGPWIAPLNPDPHVLAMTLMMPWAIAMPGCPMSNTLLAMHARYQTPVRELLRRNRIFGFKMLLLCIATLYAYEQLAA